MERANHLCHRCGGKLAEEGGESTFCPHCGAPQLLVLEENVSGSGVETARGTSTGASPPPNPARIIWSSVVAFAAGVAGVAVVLMIGVLWLPVAFPFVWLWTVCGAVLVLGLYRRRHPESLMNPRVGARVGLVYGLLAVLAFAVGAAGSGLVARFLLHSMSSVDTFLSNAIAQAVDQQMRQSAAQPAGSPAFTADQMRMLYSPEARAGVSLFALSLGALFLILFSTVGGAVGGLMRSRQR